MKYYFSKQVEYSFEEALERTIKILDASGFVLINTIDLREKIKNALDKDIPRYTIVQACNPNLASRIINIEPRVGVLLPCNGLVRECMDGSVEICLVNMYQSLSCVTSSEVDEISLEVSQKFELLMDSL